MKKFLEQKPFRLQRFFSMNFTAITISVVSALLLRVLYEFLMNSFKATEHLYRIAESLDRNGSSDK